MLFTKDVGQVLQDLKSLQTVLVQADSKLRQSAVNGKINVCPNCDINYIVINMHMYRPLLLKCFVVKIVHC